jgi:hypothetical protein
MCPDAYGRDAGLLCNALYEAPGHPKGKIIVFDFQQLIIGYKFPGIFIIS